MIKIDYLIKRNEGDVFTEFYPEKLLSNLPILSYVQGPNASGKSTILNIIALAFFGLDLSKEEFNPDLRERVEVLTNSSHQKVKFKIEVENEKLGVKFTSEKNDLDRELFVVRKIEDGKNSIVSSDLFRREYKLIYDIPDDPLGRLPLLLLTLKDQQKDLGADITNLRQQVRNIIDEIKDSKDPEQIKKIKEKINEHEALYQEAQNKETEQITKSLQMKEYYYTRFLDFYLNEQKDIKTRINEIQKRLNSQKRIQSKSYKSYMELTQQLNKNISNIENLIRSIKLVLPNLIEKDQEQRYKLWKIAEIRNEIYHPDIYDSLRVESKFFTKKLSEMTLDERSTISDDLEKKKLLMTLVVILSDYQDNKIKIPGTNLLIKEFINTIEQEINRLDEITAKVENISQCANSIEQLILMIDDGINTADKIKQNKNLSEGEFEDFTLQQEDEDLDLQLQTNIEKIKELRGNAIKSGLDPDTLENYSKNFKLNSDYQLYETFSEKQILDKLDDLEKKIAEQKTIKRKTEKRLDEEKDDLVRFESKKPHKYQDNFTEIQTLLLHVQNLEKLFRSFDSWLGKIIENDIELDNLPEDQLIYTEEIGRYLAKKIDVIKYIDSNYEVKSVDVVRKVLNTKKGKVIHFSDLSTGQGQGAYLGGLLNMNENKKIIALFDEIAMMDNNTLEPIMEKLRNLYEEGKLLMAIIVQKSNTGISVEDMLCSRN